MSQKNVQVVRRFYDAWARDELPGPVELMDPEIEYVNPAGAVEPGIRRGLAAFGRAVEQIFEAWETWQMAPEEFRAVGDQVAVVVRYRARGEGAASRWRAGSRPCGLCATAGWRATPGFTSLPTRWKR